MRHPRRVLRFGLPTLIVCGLALVALWRIGGPPPVDTSLAVGTSGRIARLENVEIRTVTSPRTFWIDEGGMRTFVVLDPDVKRSGAVSITAGSRLTLVGLVRPAPGAADAMRQWAIDHAVAEALEKSGTYLHATEIAEPAR